MFHVEHFSQNGKAGSLPLRQLSHGLCNLGQLGIGGAALQPQAVINGGSAADHGSGGHVLGDAALGYGDGAVSDGAAVAYVDEVVDLGAVSDAGFAYAGAVDAGV